MVLTQARDCEQPFSPFTFLFCFVSWLQHIYKKFVRQYQANFQVSQVSTRNYFKSTSDYFVMQMRKVKVKKLLFIALFRFLTAKRQNPSNITLCVVFALTFMLFGSQVNLCFDQFVYKLSDQIFSHYKAQACR